MARKPRKVKAGAGMVHVSFLVEAATAQTVDKLAEKMTREDPDGRAWTRTDVLRKFIRDGLIKAQTE